MAKAKVVGWTPKLGKALQSLVSNGSPLREEKSGTPSQTTQELNISDKSPKQETITVQNSSDKKILRFTPVSLGHDRSGSFLFDDTLLSNGITVLGGKTAVDDTRPWGIAMEDIEPGNLGEVIISGLAPACFSSGTTGNYLTPSEKGLIVSPVGRAEVIDHNPFSEIGLGLILLSGGNHKQAAYQLTLVDDSVYNEDGTPSKLQVTLLDGRDPNSKLAGIFTYSNAVYDVAVPKTTLEVPSNDGEYYVHAVYDYSKCEVYLTTNLFQSAYFPTLLCARVRVEKKKIISTQNMLPSVTIPSVGRASAPGFTFEGELKYENYILTASYKVSARLYRNNVEIMLERDDIPTTGRDNDGYLCFGIKELCVEPGTEPEMGFYWNDHPDGWTTFILLNYHLSEDRFSVWNFSSPTVFTFTQILFNADEEGV